MPRVLPVKMYACAIINWIQTAAKSCYDILHTRACKIQDACTSSFWPARLCMYRASKIKGKSLLGRIANFLYMVLQQCRH